MSERSVAPTKMEVPPVAAARRRLASYPACADTGSKWLARVPAHWRVRRLKFMARSAFSSVDKHTVDGEVPVRLCNYTDVYYRDFITPDIDFMQATATPEEVRRFGLRRGDVLLTKDSESWDDIAVPAYVTADLPGVLCGYHLAQVRPVAGEMDGRYLFRVMQAHGINDQLQVEATGITRFGLPNSALREAIVPVPPLPEQQAIAAFLDRETARIDVLVVKKEQLIALLLERVRSITTHAITRGLNRAARLKDSGVPVIGAIPASWTVSRLMHLTQPRRPIMYGIVLPGPDVEGGVPIVKGGDVSPLGLRRSKLKRTTAEIEAGYVRSRLAGGDLVFAIRGSIGAVQEVPEELRGANITQDVARVSVRSDVHGPWLVHALRSAAAFAQLDAGATGATIRGINIRDLKRVFLPVPSMPEQMAIASFLRDEIRKIDALVNAQRGMISLLEEERAALISAAVSGQIDVRGEVAA